MKWTKIKNIMICFLMTMNLFMLLFIAVSTYRQSVIPDEVITSTRKVLEEAKFDCSSINIPDKYFYLAPLDATFYSASDLSDLFFGKQVAFSTSEQSLVAKYEGATLTVYSNYFVYNSGKKPSEESSSELKKALEELGIDMDDAVYDEQAQCFYKMHNDRNLFNMYIEAKTDKDGKICHISAQWPKKTTEHSKSKISFTENFMKLKDKFPRGGKINKIELGYALKSLGGEKYLFSPTWRVMVDNELEILD